MAESERSDYNRFGVAAHRNENGELYLSAYAKTLGSEAAGDFAAWIVTEFGEGTVLADDESYAAALSEQTEHINTASGPVEVPAKRRPGRPRKDASA